VYVYIVAGFTEKKFVYLLYNDEHKESCLEPNWTHGFVAARTFYFRAWIKNCIFHTVELNPEPRVQVVGPWVSLH
jgi:hypothetical protein